MSNQTDFKASGFIDFAYISRLSDQSIINIPYRLSSIEFFHQKENISLYANLALEFQIRDSNY